MSSSRFPDMISISRGLAVGFPDLSSISRDVAVGMARQDAMKQVWDICDLLNDEDLEIDCEAVHRMLCEVNRTPEVLEAEFYFPYPFNSRMTLFEALLALENVLHGVKIRQAYTRTRESLAAKELEEETYKRLEALVERLIEEPGEPDVTLFCSNCRPTRKASIRAKRLGFFANMQ